MTRQRPFSAQIFVAGRPVVIMPMPCITSMRKVVGTLAMSRQAPMWDRSRTGMGKDIPWMKQ